MSTGRKTVTNTKEPQKDKPLAKSTTKKSQQQQPTEEKQDKKNSLENEKIISEDGVEE